MKSIQEILDLALESGLYVSREEYDKMKLNLCDDHSYYMCDVLGTICADGVITEEELNLSSDEIAKYIQDSKYNASCMSFFLEKNSLPSSHEDKLEIYKDWENKPKISVQDTVNSV